MDKDDELSAFEALLLSLLVEGEHTAEEIAANEVTPGESHEG